jgi:hypothetical protein
MTELKVSFERAASISVSNVNKVAAMFKNIDE